MGRSQGISTATTTVKAPGFRLSRYQWLALISAFHGWLVDSMDLNLPALALVPGVGQLPHRAHAAGIGKIGSQIISDKRLT